jgi:hypothetical protein
MHIAHIFFGIQLGKLELLENAGIRFERFTITLDFLFDEAFLLFGRGDDLFFFFFF